MSADQSARATFGRGLELVRDALFAYADPVLRANLGSNHLERARGKLGRREPRDPSPHDAVFWLLVISTDQLWNEIFKHRLHHRVPDLSRRVLRQRNAWAHMEPETFEMRWASQAIETSRELLAKIDGAKQQRTALALLIEELIASAAADDDDGSSSQTDEVGTVDDADSSSGAAPEGIEGQAKRPVGEDSPPKVGADALPAVEPDVPAVDEMAEHADEPGPEMELALLDVKQRRVVEHFSSREPKGVLVRGAAGSGKTMVLMHSIASLMSNQQLSFDSSTNRRAVLYTSFTNSLVRTAQVRLAGMIEQGRRGDLSCATLSSLALRVVLTKEANAQVVTERDARRYLAEVLRETVSSGGTNALTLADLDWVLEEINEVICGRGVSRSEYLQVSKAKARADVWEVYERLSAVLREGPSPRYLWNEVYARAASEAVPRYDFVFIDEVQDLPPIAVRFAARLCTSPSNVSVAIDRDQTIYRKVPPWRLATDNIDYTGRAYTLQAGQRTAAEIVEAIAQLDLVPASIRSTENPNFGARPLLLRRATPQWGENLNNRLRQIITEEGLTLSDVAVLCPTELEMAEASAHLNPSFKPREMKSKAFDPAYKGTKITTIHAAKGMGFPLVVVFGIDRGRLPLEHPTPSASEHDAQQRRLLYVACTRAINRLVVVTKSDAPSPYLESADESLWDIEDV